MPTIKERNAAFDAMKALVPSMYAHFVSDAMILEFADAALLAAERVRSHP